MWDGNDRACRGHPSGSGLSENQCGMETTELAEVTLQEVGLSENQCGMETWLVDAFKDYVVRVEREPMWDGNGRRK